MNDPSEKYLLSETANLEPITWLDVLAGALPIVCVLLLCVVILVLFKKQTKRLRGPIYTFFWLYVGYLTLTILLWTFFREQFSTPHPLISGFFGVAFFITLVWLGFRLKR